MIIKRAIYLLHRYYSSGRVWGGRYHSALLVIAFLIMMNIGTLKVLFWGGSMLFGDTEAERFFCAIGYILPVYFLLALIYKKSDFEEMEKFYEIADIKHDYLVLWGYVVLTFLAFVLIVLLRKNYDLNNALNDRLSILITT